MKGEKTYGLIKISVRERNFCTFFMEANRSKIFYNPGRNIWRKVKKSSKLGQDFKNLLSNFACFLTAIVKV